MSARHTRIFFLNRYAFPDESATSQLLSDLLFALAAQTYEVHVVCSRQLYGNPAARLAAEEVIQRVQIHRLWTTRFGRGRLVGRMVDYASFYLSCAFTLLRRLRSGDIVVAMTDPPLISIVAHIAARCRGSMHINWLQDVFPEVATRILANPRSRLNAFLCRLRDLSMRSARMNVLIGNRMLEYFYARGFSHATTCIVENWADADEIQPLEASVSALRNRLSLCGHFVIAYSGNLGRAHEFDTLIGAAELLREDPAFVFLIIGGGAKMEQLQRAVAERRLSGFRFLPYQPRQALQDSLAAADVHVVSLMPALEGLIVPSKLYGILAAGRPVVFIGDSDGEVARVINEARCGIAVDVNAARELASAFQRLRSEPDTCADMGKRARETLVKRYSRQRAIESWVGLLNASALGRADP